MQKVQVITVFRLPLILLKIVACIVTDVISQRRLPPPFIARKIAAAAVPWLLLPIPPRCVVAVAAVVCDANSSADGGKGASDHPHG
jgi:hypothetical protein